MAVAAAVAEGAAAAPAASSAFPFLFSAARKFFTSVHVCVRECGCVR